MGQDGGKTHQEIHVLVEHGKDAGFLSLRMHIEDIMMAAMAEEHIRIVVGRDEARDDMPLGDGPESGLEHAGIAPLLPCPPLTQRIPSGLPQVALGIGRQFIGQHLWLGLPADVRKNLLH